MNPYNCRLRRMPAFKGVLYNLGRLLESEKVFTKFGNLN